MNAAHTDAIGELFVGDAARGHPGFEQSHGENVRWAYSDCNEECTVRPMVARIGPVHHAHMAKTGPKHHLRAWRKHRELTLEAVAERIELLSEERAGLDPDARAVTMTHATLSRIERGKLQYNEHLLELLAEIYQTDIASLLIRDPTEAEAIWTIWEALAPNQRNQVVEIAKTIKRTGTEG